MMKRKTMSHSAETTSQEPVEKTSPSKLGERGPATFDFHEFSKTKMFPRIDGLRAVAILLVLWHHTGGDVPGAWLGYGYHGVTLFFAISGFLITTLLLREKERAGRISLTRFFARRSLRIFPLYFLVLGVYFLLVKFVESDEVRKEQFFGNLIYFATYTSNWFVERGSIFFCSWSLATEEQYYLVWPFIVAIVARRYAFGAAILALILWGVAKFGISPGLDEPNLPVTIMKKIAPAICLGSLSAIIIGSQRGFDVVSGLFRRPLAGAVLLIATVSALIWGAHESVMAVCSATVVIYYVVAPNPIGGRLLTWKPAVFIGAISYGMYMWHLICKNGVGIVWSKTIGGSPPSALILFALTLGAAILVSWISFKFYEKPFLRLKKYFG
ncbi:acyltransferase [bacterium]|nr:acyltransferase [bacterium]